MRRSFHSAPRTTRSFVPAGRSGVGKILVAGAVEVDGGAPQRARLKVIESFAKKEIHAFVLGTVAPANRLVTDDWPSYRRIAEIKHKATAVRPIGAHRVALDPSPVLEP